MAYSVEPDQMSRSVASDMSLHSLFMPVFWNSKSKFVRLFYYINPRPPRNHPGSAPESGNIEGNLSPFIQQIDNQKYKHEFGEKYGQIKR